MKDLMLQNMFGKAEPYAFISNQEIYDRLYAYETGKILPNTIMELLVKNDRGKVIILPQENENVVIVDKDNVPTNVTIKTTDYSEKHISFSFERTNKA